MQAAAIKERKFVEAVLVDVRQRAGLDRPADIGDPAAYELSVIAKDKTDPAESVAGLTKLIKDECLLGTGFCKGALHDAGDLYGLFADIVDQFFSHGRQSLIQQRPLLCGRLCY